MAEPAPRTFTLPSGRQSMTMVVLGALLVLGMGGVLSVYRSAEAAGGTLAPAIGGPARSRAAAPAPDLVVSAPAPAASAEDQLRAAVERANRAFIDARGQASAAPLEGIAAGDWMASERAAISDLRARGQSQRWRLVKLEYLVVRPEGDTGFVCTSETWELTTLGPGEAVSGTSSYTFQEGYHLARTGGAWYVQQIDVG